MAFQQLNEYLSQPPIMSRPKVDEVLFAYIVVASHVMSLVLVRVDSGVQRPIYYVRKSLHEAKVRYLPLEKAILAMVHGIPKLPHYFQLHTVVVLTQLPLRFLLRSADYIGRIAKWSTILGAFNIKYMPRTLSRAKSSPIWQLSLMELCQRREWKRRTWMKNQLMQSPYKNLYLGRYMLMVQRTTEDLEQD